MKEGTKFDENKPRWDLLPFRELSEVVDILTFGAKKYAPNNWQKVDNAESRYTAAALRHFTSWIRGEKKDPESGKSHLAHVVCNILFLMWFENEVPDIFKDLSSFTKVMGFEPVKTKEVKRAKEKSKEEDSSSDFIDNLINILDDILPTDEEIKTNEKLKTIKENIDELAEEVVSDIIMSIIDDDYAKEKEDKKDKNEK